MYELAGVPDLEGRLRRRLAEARQDKTLDGVLVLTLRQERDLLSRLHSSATRLDDTAWLGITPPGVCGFLGWSGEVLWRVQPGHWWRYAESQTFKETALHGMARA